MQFPEIEGYGGRRWSGIPLHLLRSSNPYFALGFIRERLKGDTSAPATEPGLVSIIIPCYNQREFVPDAIASALAQRDVEVIVVDDGSTDGLEIVAERFPQVRWIRQRNRGVAAARNAGLHSSRGEHVLFLDADDRLLPGAIDVLRDALSREPDAPFAYGGFAKIDRNGHSLGRRWPQRASGDAYAALLQSNFICLPATVLYRRDALLAAGGFARGADAAADYDLYLRLARGRTIAHVEEVVSEYRAHAHNMSARADRMLAETLKVHARQRRYASDPPHLKAWRAGRRYWREFYGQKLLDEVRNAYPAGRLIRAAAVLLTLGLRAPGVLLGRASRRLFSHRKSA